MNSLTLTIGDKNLSSWSLRPWLLMKETGIAFTEETILLDRPETRSILKEKSPSGLVPFLTHAQGGESIQLWDSLAIAEYLNDLYPEKNLWPEDRAARALARSISAEMHSGFAPLRAVWPMQVLKRDIGHLTSGGVQRDIDRVLALWSESRRKFGAGGPFLFGAFSIADAMYAPVVTRFVTYGPVAMDDDCAAYMKTIMGLGGMKAWIEGAAAQTG